MLNFECWMNWKMEISKDGEKNEIMSDFDHANYIAWFKKYAADVLSSEEKSKNFLISAWINDANGKLTKEFGWE